MMDVTMREQILARLDAELKGAVEALRECSAPGALFKALNDALTEKEKQRLAESWFDIDVEAS